MKNFDFQEIEDLIWNEPALEIENTVIKDLYFPRKYTEALQKALYKDNPEDLSQLLKKKVPIHPLQLPILAAVIDMRTRHKKNGRRPRLTPAEEIKLHQHVWMRCISTGWTLDDCFKSISSEENPIEGITSPLSEKTIRDTFKKVDKEFFNNRFINFYKSQRNRKNLS
jgi:hypothetical protein